MKAMNILKTVRYLPGILGILGAAALALSCEQITEPPSRTKAPAGSGGTGRVIISASAGSAALEESAAPTESADSTKGGALPGITRTILPTQTPVFSRYRVVFSRSGYADIRIDNVKGIDVAGLSQELEAGSWTVTVSAYRALSTGGAEYEAARGSKVFTVTAGQTAAVRVSIAPVPVAKAAGKGLFTYTVTFPQGATGTLTFGNEAPVTLVSGVKVSVEKAPGYYDLSVTLSKGALSAGVWDKAHIYAGLESEAAFTFTNDNFAPTVYLAGTVTLPGGVTIASGTIKVYISADYTTPIGSAPIPEAGSDWVVSVPGSYAGSTLYLLVTASGTDGKTYIGTRDSGGAVPEAGKRDIAIAVDARIRSLAAVKAYLAAASGGASAGTPVSLPVELDLANDWTGLLSAIASAGKYIALDLSACTMTGMTGTAGEFDPVYSNSTGKAYITDLVLPNTAASIKAGTYNNAELGFFTTFGYFTALKSVSGSGIVTVGNYAFQDCAALTEVSLPAATSIGSAAFDGCAALTEMSLPAATSIGGSAFRGCVALTEVSLPSTVTSIGLGAFAGCVNLDTIMVADGNAAYKSNDGMLLNKAGDQLVAYPGARGVVTLPDSITSIGSLAFAYSGVLTEVSLPAATYIGVYAFSNCGALTTVSLPAATNIVDYAFYGCGALTEVNLPAATSIGNNAFQECAALTEVSLPAATSIGIRAFNGCTGLTKVSLPVATSIGTYAFASCWALTEVSLPAATNIGASTFASCVALATVSLPAATSIGASAFWYCSALTTVSLPAATTIGSSAFSYCRALTTVGLPVATSIGSETFYECAALTMVDLPAAMYIGSSVFYKCTALTEVSLPAATSIGNYAFADCRALTSVRLGSAAPTLGDSIFYWINTAQTVTVWVPLGATGYGTVPATYNYRSTTSWGNSFRGGNQYITVNIINPDSIAAHLYAASGGASADDPVLLPVVLDLASGWNDILSGIAFTSKYVALDLSACTMSGTEFDPVYSNSTGKAYITELVLPGAATSIKAGNLINPTFKNFSALKSVSGSGIVTVGNYAFQDCATLTEVSLPAAMSIGSSAFAHCTALTTVSLPAATSIGNGAFAYCRALTEVSLPAATSINGYAFQGCTALTTVNLASAAPTLGDEIFGYINTAQTVTVKVPSGAKGYGTIPADYSGSDTTANWGNGFRGGGWTGSAFVSISDINNNITLNIVYEP